MDKLPFEIIENILLKLDNKTLVNFFSVNSKFIKFDNQMFWKIKCNKEYNFYISRKLMSWKHKYIKLYESNCINCFKKTKLFNNFFNQKICRNCEKSNPKYHCISYSKVRKKYFLTNKDLSNIRFINRHNPFNSKFPLKLYLKTDILNYIQNHYGYSYYKDLRENKINSSNARSIAFLTKFNILNTILIFRYNIDIVNILPDINRYSNNLYIRYLRTVNENSTVNSQNLIECCLELNFIMKYTDLDWNNFDDFNSLLSYFILFSKQIIPLNINEYIDNKILYTTLLHKDKIHRKHQILKLLPNQDLTNPLIYNYIYTGNTSLKHIQSLIMLENFLYEHTNITDTIMTNIINGVTFDKFSLYFKSLNNWFYNYRSNRSILPYQFYNFLFD